MQNFVDLLLGVWNQGLLGISISQIIISLIILTTAFVLRGVISNIVIKWLENFLIKLPDSIFINPAKHSISILFFFSSLSDLISKLDLLLNLIP